MKFDTPPPEKIDEGEIEHGENVGSERAKETNKAQAESRFFSLAAKHHELIDELIELQKNNEDKKSIEEKKSEISKISDEVSEVAQRLNRMYKSEEEQE